MSKKAGFKFHQSAVVPYKIEKGSIYILLITSKSKKKWIIPNGRIEKNFTPQESALKEAEEEAGVKGMITNDTVGWYSYLKQKTGKINKVMVFPMKVTEELETWKEMNLRSRAWCTLEEVLKKISNRDISQLIEKTVQLVFNRK